MKPCKEISHLNLITLLGVQTCLLKGVNIKLVMTNEVI